MNDHVQPLLDALKPREVEVLRLMAEGFSNEEIAAQLVVTVATVRWHNRQLYSKLGVHSRTLAVAHARHLGLLEAEPSQMLRQSIINRSTLPSQPPSHLPPTNLPLPTTSFVGRAREVAKARQLLSSSRLLTMTGPGGTGKTRLALQVAEAVRDYFADGVWFVPLAAVQDPNLVAATLARALKVRETPAESVERSLIKHLQQKQMLLVLDNFEHLLTAASLVSTLLAATAQVKLLVTSREVLRLSGEQEYSIPPLTVPEREQLYTPAILADYEAVQLFVERARASQPDFALTAENAAAVAQICTRLDGLPLALELAAARIKLLTPQQMLGRFDRGLSGLGQGPRDAPARQRTLQATIDWSYQLLNAAEKLLLNRLVVFRGGWTLEAMEALAGTTPRDEPTSAANLDVIELLQSLIDKSLVQVTDEPNGDSRFRMLETVREHIWQQLAPNVAQAAQTRHRDWFVDLVERAGQGMQTAESMDWYARLRADEDNIHAALSYCLDTPEDRQVGLRFAAALYDYWHMRANYHDAHAWLTTLLASTGPVESAVYARALLSAARMAKFARDFAAVDRFAGKALEISRTLGDREIEGHALHFVAHYAQEQGCEAAAEELYARSVELFQTDGNRWGEAETLNCWGDMQRQFGRYAKAEAILGRSLVLRRGFHNWRGVAATLVNLGCALCRGNEATAAAASFGEAVEICRRIGNKGLLLLCVNGFGGVALIRGELPRAAALLGASDTLFNTVGLDLETPDRVDYEWFVTQVRAQLPAARLPPPGNKADNCRLSKR